MAGGAAGGFVTRAFDSILKECSSAKKFPELEKAIQNYTGHSPRSTASFSILRFQFYLMLSLFDCDKIVIRFSGRLLALIL